MTPSSPPSSGDLDPTVPLQPSVPRTTSDLTDADLPTQQVAAPQASGDAAAQEEGPGQFFGPYRLVALLGEGGFGSVWRAEQKEPILREVALKVIKLGMDSREIISRFDGERQALALMDHPNIAAVLDAGKTPAGRPYFAMELVKGVPLTEYCDAHRLTVRQRLELLLPVCMAVQHAHQKGVLHRDLKPANILVQEVDGKPLPKVIDFGIAKALQTGAGAAPGLSLLQSQGFSIIGTPLYMSPEQAGLSGQDVDSRSDIYSLGVVLYELLTGSTPLTKETVKKAAADELLRLIREQDPPSLERCLGKLGTASATVAGQRQTDIKKLTTQMRGDLDWIVLKALEKDRERRYASAAALAQDIEHHLRDEPVSAGPPDAAYRLAKLARKHKGPLMAAGLVLASLVLGLGLALWQAVRATKAERKAEARLVDAEKARDAAEELVTEGIHGLREKLAAVGRVEVMEEMVKAAQNYYQQLSPELQQNDETQRHLASLAMNRALIALAQGQSDDKEFQKHSAESLRLLRGLMERNPQDEALHKESCFAMLTLCIHAAESSELGGMVEKTDAVVKSCQTWLDTHPDTLWAMYYQTIGQMFASVALIRELRQPAAAFPRIEHASRNTLRMRQVHGDKQEVLASEGLMHGGRARMAESLGQTTLARMSYESAISSFTKALELGENSVMREALYMSIYRAGEITRQAGIKAKNEAEIKKGMELLRKSVEGREKLIALEPGRAERWRQLGYSCKALANTLLLIGDQAAANEHYSKELRCREEAIQLSRRRPLLYMERAIFYFDQARRQSSLSGAFAVDAFRSYFSGLEDVKQSVEMADGRLVIGYFQLKNLTKELAKLAQEHGQQGLEWVDKARGLLQPLAEADVPDADFQVALAFLDDARLHLLDQLGKDKEAEAARMELAKLSGGSLRPAAMHDRALAGLTAIGEEIGRISRAPAAERPALQQGIEAALQPVDKLLTAALAAEPENKAFRETQALRWRLAGQVERAMGAKTQALECFDKALAAMPADVLNTERYGILEQQYTLLGELRQFDRRLINTQALVKLATQLVESPSRNGSADDQHRLSLAWQKVSEALGAMGKETDTLAPYIEAVRAEERAVAIQPTSRRYQWEWLKVCLRLSAAYLRGNDIEKATQAAFPVHQKALALLDEEPQIDLPRGVMEPVMTGWYTQMRELGFRVEAVQALRLLANFREKLEQRGAPPTTPDKSYLCARVSLASLLHDEKRSSEALAEVEKVRAGLPAATPEVQVEARNILRGFLSRTGAKAEAESEAQTTYQLSLTIPQTGQPLQRGGEWVALMASNGRPKEALEESQKIWKKSGQEKWPADASGRQLAIFANRVLDSIHYGYIKDPQHDWAGEMQVWLRRFIEAVPLKPEPTELPSDVVYLLRLWMHSQMERGEGTAEHPKLCQQLAARLKNAPHFTLSSAALMCLMVPEPGPHRNEGIAMAARAWKTGQDQSTVRFTQALALIRDSQPQEALTLLQPLEKSTDTALWLVTHSLMALAYQQAGDTAKANAELDALAQLPDNKARYLQSPANRSSIFARLIIREASAARTKE